MKSELTNVIAQDRLATWEEIRRATISTPQCVMEHFLAGRTHCDVDSDVGGTIRYTSEEFEFFAYLSEALNSNAN